MISNLFRSVFLLDAKTINCRISELFSFSSVLLLRSSSVLLNEIKISKKKFEEEAAPITKYE